jgi:hypothetical protein
LRLILVNIHLIVDPILFVVFGVRINRWMLECVSAVDVYTIHY